MEIRIGQKHRSSLEALQYFLSESLGIQPSIYEGASSHVLVVASSQTVKLICKRLLGAGLHHKRAQAELVMNHTSATHSAVCRELQELRGNQGRFRRQAHAGIARATEINRLQMKRSHLLRSPRFGLPEGAQEVDELTLKIDELKKEHQRKELEREICAMQSHLEEVRRTSTLTGLASEVELPEPSPLATSL